jgi:hypothetical protein
MTFEWGRGRNRILNAKEISDEKGVLPFQQTIIEALSNPPKPDRSDSFLPIHKLIFRLIVPAKTKAKSRAEQSDG